MEQRNTNNVPDAAQYVTEDEIKELNQLELDIAVKYCVEYAKQEALAFSRDNEERLDKKTSTQDGLELEDIDVDWKTVEAKQKEVKYKVMNWLVSEKKI